jgi:uncharacterized surface protein with fasciclin (FAS1) repeats
LSADAANFSTFVEIVRAGGYVDDLSAPGPLTVFAPTNTAFAPPFDQGRLAELRSSEGAAAAFLRELMVEGLVDITTSATLETLGGFPAELVVSGPSVTYRGSVVTGAPIDASNGVMHGLATVPEDG